MNKQPVPAIPKSLPLSGLMTVRRFRAQSSVSDLPSQRVVLAVFQVKVRGKLKAEFRAERGPDGCGVIELQARDGGFFISGSVGVPAATPESLLVAVARRQADIYVRVKAPTGSVKRAGPVLPPH